MRDAEVIRIDRINTVKSLTFQLQTLLASGNDDSGFPILRQHLDEHGMRVIAYIGANELEHALSRFSLCSRLGLSMDRYRR